jgi:serpin B
MKLGRMACGLISGSLALGVGAGAIALEMRLLGGYSPRTFWTAFFATGGGVFWLLDWLGLVSVPYTPPLLSLRGGADVTQAASEPIKPTPIGFEEKPAPETSLRKGLTHRHASGSDADDHNDFALTLYRQLLVPSTNLFFSPLSIRTALAMACAGARGETATELATALRLSTSDEERNVAFADITNLNADGTRQYAAAMANSLWAHDRELLEVAFLDAITRHYRAQAHVLDFVHDAEAARGAINAWIRERTHDRIQDLIPPGGVNAETRLVLANAAYFKGRWALPFLKPLTVREAFHAENGIVQVPLMRQRVHVRHVQARGFQAAELEYEDADFSMLVLLPDRHDGLPELDRTLSARMLHQCRERMYSRAIDLVLPRFALSWRSMGLSTPLRALGISLAFTRFQADFSGINGREPGHKESLFISNVFHKAFIDVNEEGTEAAAATSMGMDVAASLRGRKPPPIPIFRADHPFLFAILDRKSGAIVFLGRMANPGPND